MLPSDLVPLERTFSELPASTAEINEEEIYIALGLDKRQDWSALEALYRCVILAGAGIGKTVEMLRRAQHLNSEGRLAFFIRIEDIDDHFEEAFEVGEKASFDAWRESGQEAWFFLDSVDEARLTGPRAFEKAIRRFARTIKDAGDRAHIFISSRPYSWRAKTDRAFIEQLLPYRKPLPNPEDSADAAGSGSPEEETPSDLDVMISGPAGLDEIQDDGAVTPQGAAAEALSVYVLKPLRREEIAHFAEHRQTPDVAGLMNQLDRLSIEEMANRPYDLDMILEKWRQDRKLEGRYEIIDHAIDQRLSEIDSNRSRHQHLGVSMARKGARAIAAAVLLTGESGICTPDPEPFQDGINAKDVLPDWSDEDIHTLLESGIFNDVIYGMVRFRHRDTREFLAAEWLAELLQTGHSRTEIEALIFREQYGERIITPRLRPVLAWLFVLDNNILNRTLACKPEIIVDGGDAARLPMSVRRQLLNGIVTRIAENKDDGSARGNGEIARIAHPDLSEDVIQLIGRHSRNDDAIFFLGRLAWLGEMSGCALHLLPLALDPRRGDFARVAAARAVMTCGTPQQRDELWQGLNTNQAPLPRRLLAEIIEDADASAWSVGLLTASIEKLTPYQEYQVNGLEEALHDFIDRLPMPDENGGGGKLLAFVRHLWRYLRREPHVERAYCQISKEHVWLLGPATRGVERLVESRSPHSFDEAPTQIMLSVPKVRFWQGEDFSDHKDRLAKLIPAWTELNDHLFWQDVEMARERKRIEEKGPFDDVWDVWWPEHFWRFGLPDVARMLAFVETRPLPDDRLIALTAAHLILRSNDAAINRSAELHAAAGSDKRFLSALKALLQPVETQAKRVHSERKIAFEQERAERRERRAAARKKQIQELKARPEFLSNPPGIKSDEINHYQYNLLQEIRAKSEEAKHYKGSDWKKLIPDYGKIVAEAYRDGAMAKWRQLVPPLRSEGATSNDGSWTLIFAMKGLEIEAREVGNFPENLTQQEAKHAVRYIAWELNGFPDWLERVHATFPDQTIEAIKTEIDWELANSNAEEPLHYVLQDIVYHAPWLCGYLADWLCNRLTGCTSLNPATLGYCLHIILSGGIQSDRAVQLATGLLTQEPREDQRALLHALWVTSDPANGIPAAADWLSSLSQDGATEAAMDFVMALVAENRDSPLRNSHGNHRDAGALKDLYLLMHRHIRSEEDTDRFGEGVRSITRRDDAQKARDRLFGMLRDLPGKAAYLALCDLVEQRRDTNGRAWVTKCAYERAEQDGDLEPWTPKQVHEFGDGLTITPRTNAQLSDLVCHSLTDLKDWLENGDTSPAASWGKAASEAEMRNLVAGWLIQQSRGRFTCSQENELPNAQRTDIRIEAPGVASPVPVELKLLDKGWSGPKLCERLGNQLAGDYLRQRSAKHGVFLLIWCGQSNKKTWRIGGRSVDLDNLETALASYWTTISPNHPDIDAVKIVVIDLTRRGSSSGGEQIQPE